MTSLEVLHHKIRELGGRHVRDFFPGIHAAKFSSIASGLSTPTPEMELKIGELWPDLLNQSESAAALLASPKETNEEVEVVKANLGANQLNMAILMPVRNSYDPAVVNSIVGLIRRTGCGWIQRPFDSMIARSRNILATYFLKSDFEWSLWLDDDMIVPNGEPNWFRAALQANKHIEDEYCGLIAPYQLASWGKTLVSAVYFSRHGVAQITAGFEPGTSMTNKLPHRGLVPARFCGFGCVMIHRKVYEDIIVKKPELGPQASNECGFFTPFQKDGRMVGEDEAFCLHALDVGHNTFLDTTVVCGHVGRKVNYIPEGPIK